MLKTRLETISNVAVIVVAVVFTGTTLHDHFLRAGNPSENPAKRLIGKKLDLPASLGTGDRGTVTLFISRSCHFCTDSMGFYRQLAAERPKACDVRLVAVGPKERETRDEMATYLAEHSLAVDGMEMVNFAGLGVSTTPTLVLRDAGKVVRDVWIGQLPDTGAKEVLSRIRALCSH